MIAYLFWHRPGGGTVPASYEALLGAFHQSLAADPPEGCLGSTCHRVTPLPWLASGRPPAGRARREGGSGYEDRYFLEDASGLDPLDRAAVTGAREEAHAAVAELADTGVGGLYRLRREGYAEEGRPADGLWLSKPRGRPYAAFLEALERLVPPEAQIWQRQMVLGPAPEFGLVGPPDAFRPGRFNSDWNPVLVRREPVWPPKESE